MILPYGRMGYIILPKISSSRFADISDSGVLVFVADKFGVIVQCFQQVLYCYTFLFYGILRYESYRREKRRFFIWDSLIKLRIVGQVKW